jgi:peroxiredoxin Q/BCP
LRDNWKAVKAADAQVLGINPQAAASHRSFREKYKFPFPLLVDKGQRVAELYHANGLIVKRTVYLIDAEGIIRFARRGMPSPSVVLAAGN